MPTKKNSETRRKNNERCLALPDQPFLRPEGVFSVGQLANETTHRSGRKLNYPKCRLHHKSVITWANGSLTAPVPDYDNSERTAKADKAKAQAGGSHMARGRRRAQKKPKHNLDLGSEEDAEGESDPEYEPKILDFIVLRAFEL